MCTKFCQNRVGFVKDMTKTFSCVFSVHRVVLLLIKFTKNVATRVALFGSNIGTSTSAMLCHCAASMHDTSWLVIYWNQVLYQYCEVFRKWKLTINLLIVSHLLNLLTAKKSQLLLQATSARTVSAQRAFSSTSPSEQFICRIKTLYIA